MKMRIKSFLILLTLLLAFDVILVALYWHFSSSQNSQNSTAHSASTPSPVESYANLIKNKISRPLVKNRTVEECLDLYSNSVKERLLPHFQKANVSYPPYQLAFVGLKQEKKLEVYAANKGQNLKWIMSYPILGASGHLGPKLQEGDCQVPEGLYQIEYLNPNSSYHLSMKISYPNAYDRARAAETNRTNLGGDIMIHGSIFSVGCLAMGDQAAEDLFVLTALTRANGSNRINVVLSPLDFRKQSDIPFDEEAPSWTPKLYQLIEKELKRYPSS